MQAGWFLGRVRIGWCVKIQEAFMVRTHPQWLAVRYLVSSGRIGELLFMLGNVFSYTNRDPANIRNGNTFVAAR